MRNLASELIQIGHKSENYNDITICQDDVIINFFWRRFVFLVKFRWCKFQVNIITGSGITAIYFYKGWTKNTEIEKKNILVLPNIWRLEQVRDTKFGTDIFNEMLLNAAKCQGYNFYRFWGIKGKPTGAGGGKITPLPPHLKPTTPHIPYPLRLGLIRHKLIQQSLNPSSVQVQILFAACQRFRMVKTTVSPFGWNKTIPFNCQPFRKNNLSLSLSSSNIAYWYSAISKSSYWRHHKILNYLF